MAKTTLKKGTPAAQKALKEPIKPLYIFLLIAYGFVTVLTPNLYTLDSNGPKFMTLSFLNLVAFAYLFTRKELKIRPTLYTGFFGNSIGLAYALLMVFSVLSFLNAFNKTEALLHFSKVFTTFSAAYLVSVLVAGEKRGMQYLAAAMTLLLVFDSLTVYSEVGKFIQGKIPSIVNIKSVYSNKNILAASIFVKIPFALWLLISEEKWKKFLGGTAMLMAMIATFFMSSRAFYLGSILLTIMLILYFLKKYSDDRQKLHLQTIAIVVSMLMVSFLVFSVVQKNFYPRNTKDVLSMSVTTRMSTITEDNGGGRFVGWVRSWHVLKQHPLLGVGLGNWKIATLKEENFEKGDYTYQYKAHNDFIETATEAGIFGGIFFILIFVLTGWKFIQLLMRKSPKALYYFALPAFGLFCYSFDAFFNFPQDRPEIQALFALYTGMAVALGSLALTPRPENHPDRETELQLSMEAPYTGRWIKGGSLHPADGSVSGLLSRWVPAGLFLIILAASSWFLILNFKSLKLQRIIKQEINAGKLTSKADIFLKGFPWIPNLNVVGEPIAAQKARYLINEKRYNEAISILKKDNSSPYDTRPEYFLAMAYFEKKMPDSAMYYSRKVYEMKPNHFKNLSILTNTMLQTGKTNEADSMLDKYLKDHKSDLGKGEQAPAYKDALMYATSFYDKSGNIQKACNIIDSARIWFPADTNVVKQKNYLQRKLILTDNKATIDAALQAFREKKYPESVTYLNRLLTIYPNYAEGREYRAFSHFFLKEYAKSNEDLDRLIADGSRRSNLYNLRGVNYYNLGNRDEACKNFKVARDMGDKDGISNYTRFCQQTK